MPMTTVHQPGTVAASRADARPVGRGGMLAILLLAQLMAILDANIVNVAAASIRASLRTTGAGLQMILAGYVIAYSVLLITGARVGGILGARRVFLAGLAVFTAASLACGVATAAGALTAFRFAQGAGAAVMIPQVFSLIQRYFTGAARARALALYGVVIAGGIALGQILGGVLVTADLFGQSWRPVFFINLPVGLVLLVAGAWVLPRDTPVTARRLDPAGLLALAATVLALVVPLMFGHQEGWPAWCWISLVGSIVLFVGFAAVQRRVAHPLMPGRLFIAAQVPFGLASGFAYSPTVTAALASVLPQDAPDASGLVTTMVQLAQVVGLAGIGSIYLALIARHGSAGALTITTFVEAATVVAAAGSAALLPRRG